MFVSKINNQVKISAATLGFALLSSMFIGSTSVAYASPVTADKLIELTNEARVENGFDILSINSLLLESAQGKSNDMLTKNYFAHTSPEGVTPWDWFAGVGYDYTYAGENLAKNYATAEAMFDAWMNSPTHRENILSENYKEIGIAIASDGNAIYVTQHFGTQKPGKTAGTTVTQVSPSAPVPARSVAVAPPADTTAPVIEDTPLTDAVIKQGEAISFAITVSGDPVKVLAKAGGKSVELAEKDGKWTGLLALYAGGEYTVMAEATDAAGNTATSTLGTVTVTIPALVRNDASLATMVAAYWQDVVTQEAAPIAAVLVSIVLVSLGTAMYSFTIRRHAERAIVHAIPALAK